MNDPISVEDALALARASQSEFAEARRDLAAAEADQRFRKSELQSLIRSGGTTGDPIRDFVLVAYGALEVDIDKIFADLNERIRAHAGELVLVVSTYESRFGCSGFGGKAQKIWVSNYQLGVLEPSAQGVILQIKLDDNPDSMTKWALPTIRHLATSDRWSDSREVQGSISPSPIVDITSHLLPRLTPDLSHEERQDRMRERRTAKNENPYLEILIGDDEVLAAKHEYHLLKAMLEELGVASPERTLF